MMNVVPARLVALSATAAFEVRAVDRPSHKCEAQGRLGVVAGEGEFTDPIGVLWGSTTCINVESESIWEISGSCCC
jgi:hypothetical protein